MTTVTLTPRQLATLTAIQRHVAEHGRAPTVRELLAPLGLRSMRSVHQRLESLRRAGVLVDAPRYSKGTLYPARCVQAVTMYE